MYWNTIYLIYMYKYILSLRHWLSTKLIPEIATEVFNEFNNSQKLKISHTIVQLSSIKTLAHEWQDPLLTPLFLRLNCPRLYWQVSVSTIRSPCGWGKARGGLMVSNNLAFSKLSWHSVLHVRAHFSEVVLSMGLLPGLGSAWTFCKSLAFQGYL